MIFEKYWKNSSPSAWKRSSRVPSRWNSGSSPAKSSLVSRRMYGSSSRATPSVCDRMRSGCAAATRVDEVAFAVAVGGKRVDERARALLHRGVQPRQAARCEPAARDPAERAVAGGSISMMVRMPLKPGVSLRAATCSSSITTMPGRVQEQVRLLRDLADVGVPGDRPERRIARRLAAVHRRLAAQPRPGRVRIAVPHRLRAGRARVRR